MGNRKVNQESKFWYVECFKGLTAHVRKRHNQNINEFTLQPAVLESVITSATCLSCSKVKVAEVHVEEQVSYPMQPAHCIDSHICRQIFNNPDIECDLLLKNGPAKPLLICNNLEKSPLLLLLHGPASLVVLQPCSLGSQALQIQRLDAPWEVLALCKKVEATGKPPLESDVNLQGLPWRRRGFVSSCCSVLAHGSSLLKAWEPGGDLAASAQVSRRAVPKNDSLIS